jgi:hypothetical protein
MDLSPILSRPADRQQASRKTWLSVVSVAWFASCAVAQAAPPETYTRVAEEGQSFTIKGKQVVRYGAQSTWIEQEVSGDARCTNDFFGQDPIVGIKKRCETVGGRTAANPSAGAAQAPVPSSRAARSDPPATASPAPTIQPIAPPGPLPAAAAWGTPRNSARFFVSGHSLTDDPYASNVADIARSLIGSQAANFNQQIVIGSPIRVRTGAPNSDAGYSTGKNRPFGQGLDIRKELASGGTINGDRYDTLVITENHNLIQSMQWENTVKQTRHFHEQLVAANPNARTFLHASWWAIDKNNPGAWLEAERAIAPLWHCAASRINRSLVAERRQDRVWPLPTSLALIELVERSLNGQVAGLSADNPKATLDRIFADDVHMTPLGTYYMSLVTYAAIYQRSPEGAPPVQGVNREQAAALQSLAWKFVSNFYAKYQDPSMAECNTRVAPPACVRYWTERKQTSEIRGCQSLFQDSNKENPLYYNAASDASFWFPAKP